MLIVADTSALISLAACESLCLLGSVFGEVRVPSAVADECAVSSKPWAEALVSFLAGKVVPVDPNRRAFVVPGLGRGELEAMALYEELRADRLLVDDGRARRIAASYGIEVVGSLGVLLAAKSDGVIEAVKPRLEAVLAAGIYVSDELVAEALRLAGEAEGS